LLKGVARRILAALGLVGGLTALFYSLASIEAVTGLAFTWPAQAGFVLAGGLLGAVVGYTLLPWLIEGLWQVTKWAEGRLQRTPLVDILAGAVGLIIGLIIASLLGSAFSHIPWAGRFLPTVGSVILGYLGWSVAANKREELLGLLAFVPRLSSRDRFRQEASRPPCAKVLDTSVIIDGRIADVCESGFLEGPLVIPRFVLEELRHIADSSDVLKRNRGRRGLDVLNRIQRDLDVEVQIHDRDPGPALEVDSKLVKLAKTLDGKIITNDFNLNKVAELQGVSVLNINELANALKPVVLPGEEMTVHVIRDGKESGQGVAYLDDGTMIVVDGGKKHIGKTIGVAVTSVLQTSAGRMIFAKPKCMRKAMS